MKPHYFATKNTQTLFAVFCFCAYICFTFPAALAGIDNLRFLSAFSIDEGAFYQLLKNCLVQKTYYYHFVYHGHLYFNIALLILNTAAHFTTITDYDILLVLRLIAYIGGIACIVAVYHLTRTFFNPITAWIAAVGMAMVPTEFFVLCVKTYPDTLQLLGLIVAMHYTLKMVLHNKAQISSNLYKATLAASWAFAAKFSGLFLFGFSAALFSCVIFMQSFDKKSTCSVLLFRGWAAPVSVLLLLWGVAGGSYWIGYFFSADGKIESQWIRNSILYSQYITLLVGLLLLILILCLRNDNNHAQQKILFVINHLAVAFSLFVLFFALTNPYSIIELQFIEGIVLQNLVVKSGWFVQNTESGLKWLKILSEPNLLGLMGSLLLLGIALQIIIHAIKRFTFSAENILMAWTISILGYYIVTIRIFEARYLLPIIPFALILIGVACYKFMSLHKKAYWVGLGIITLIFVTEAQQFFIALSQLKTRTQKSAIAVSGQWLAQNFEADCRIYGDGNAYIPQKFGQYLKVKQAHYSDIIEFEPDVLIINSDRYTHYTHLKDSISLNPTLVPKNDFIDITQFVNYLKTENCPYKSVLQIENIHLYAK